MAATLQFQESKSETPLLSQRGQFGPAASSKRKEIKLRELSDFQSPEGPRAFRAFLPAGSSKTSTSVCSHIHQQELPQFGGLTVVDSHLSAKVNLTRKKAEGGSERTV